MKKTLLLLSLAGSFALPAITHADTPEAKGKKADAAKRHVVAVQAAPARPRVIFYITSTPRTGSNIPMVYRRYDQRIDSASNAAVYGLSSLESTGVLDVGTALSKLDSSITLGRGR